MKTQKGITLIALIITIIVMLILVGVSVTVALNTGLFSTAQGVSKNTQIARNEEIDISDGKVKIGNTWYNSTDEYLEGSGITMLEGDGQTYYTLAPIALSFRSSADIGDFQEVQVNGETIDQSNYTITEGSTIVNLSIDYLKTLAEDDYSISIVSKTGSSSAGFSVVAPDVNSYGFYYNQPYTANLPAFGGNTALFVREDGTYDIITVGRTPDTGEYTVSGNVISATHPSLGTLTCTISSDGTEIYCNETAANFVLGDESLIADEDYLYIYDEDLGGYVVHCIDKTQDSYEPIKTGINGLPTVKLSGDMFFDEYYESGNNYLTSIKLPDGLKIIGERAFACCGLTSITLPNSLTTLEYRCFRALF